MPCEITLKKKMKFLLPKTKPKFIPYFSENTGFRQIIIALKAFFPSCLSFPS